MNSITAIENTSLVLCKSYAEWLWGADLDKPTTAFDTCGFNVSGEIVIPSVKWDNAYEFFD